ncbi:MAG: cytidine deaminase [Opitutus sp.]
MNLTSAKLRTLEKAARAAAKKAYCPYSEFPVGAAVLSLSGMTYRGCNVENASFGLCNCAERTALFSAVAAGERKITAVAIYTPTQTATAPCGACRQALNEFSDGMLVISTCDSRDRIERPLAELLPASFGPPNLNAKSLK